MIRLPFLSQGEANLAEQVRLALMVHTARLTIRQVRQDQESFSYDYFLKATPRKVQHLSQDRKQRYDLKYLNWEIKPEKILYQNLIKSIWKPEIDLKQSEVSEIGFQVFQVFQITTSGLNLAVELSESKNTCYFRYFRLNLNEHFFLSNRGERI